MNTVVSLFEQAQLAEAAYANLFSDSGVLLTNSNDVKDALIAEGMSNAQATEFVTHWRVVHQTPDTISGFSATLFESLDNPGQYNLAIRGSTWDVLGLDFQADIADIFLDGVVIEQLVDMYNYWQSLTNTGVYQAKQLVTDEAESVALKAAYIIPSVGKAYEEALLQSGNYIIDRPTLTVRTIETVDSSALSDVSLQSGIGITGLTSVNIDGHSLGGHLAMAFSRLFPSSTGSVVGVNGLGFLPTSSNVNNLFSMLGGSDAFDPSKIINVYGEEGFEVAAQDAFLKQVGGYEGIFIESATLPISVALGHSAVQMTDSLAVANLFIQLDAGLADGTPAQALSTLNGLFEKSSNQADQSLEKLVIGLTETILGTKPTITTDDRDKLYIAINALTDSTAFQSLIGKVTIEAAPTSGNEARHDLGAFLSLHYLTPFALNITDAGALNDFYELHEPLASQWNADRNLSDEQIANGEANFSDQYLADRAEMLKWVGIVNQEDAQTSATNISLTDFLSTAALSSERKYFQDISTQTEIYLGYVLNREKIIFGNNEANVDVLTGSLTGGNKEDHLYGLAGNDKLDGAGGNDYLEGGAGNDTLDGGAGDGSDTLIGGSGQDSLIGGEGNDILLGGADVDILNGGEDNDILKGGAGVDVYQFNGNYGTDIVTDSDGKGFVSLNGAVVTGSFKLGNIYKNDAVGYDVIKVNGGNSVVISKAGEANRIIVNNWTATNNFGISLTGTAPDEPTATLRGDFVKKRDADGRLIETEIYAEYVAITANSPVGNYGRGAARANTQDNLQGREGNDAIYGYGGDDYLTGVGGDDYLNGGGGVDRIYGGLGKDTLIGGAGDDYIFGSLTAYASVIDYDKWQAEGGSLTVLSDYSASRGNGWGWNIGRTIASEGDFSQVYGFHAIYNGDDIIFTGLVDSNGASIHSPNTPELIRTDQGNVIDGGAGNDRIDAGGGNDSVNGGADNDEIAGGGGADIISGGAGHDVISGDALVYSQNEFVLGYVLSFDEHQNDIIDGGSGNDYIYGQGKDDLLFGGAGNDYIYGDDLNGTKLAGAYQGNDYIDGGADADTLVGGGRNDTLYGGTGNDLLFGDSSLIDDYQGDDYLDGGDGNDTLDGNGGADTLIGGAGIDTLFGSSGDDLLNGGSGDDALIGGADADTLQGGSGADYLDGGEGNDSLEGGSGNDTLIGGDDADTLIGGSGNDGISGGSGNDVLEGGSGNDSLAGGDNADTLMGGSGNDNINGEDGDDVVEGGIGIDTLYGGSGNDTLIGSGDGDILIGDGGVDVFYAGNADTVVDQGTDEIINVLGGGSASRAGATLNTAQAPDAVSISFAGFSINVDSGVLAAGNATYAFADGSTILHSDLLGNNLDAVVNRFFVTDMAFGGKLDDQLTKVGVSDATLFGGLGHDALVGNAGNDTLIGGAGNDSLDGSDGVDDLQGDLGDDSLLGGLGNDLLQGGDGADTLLGGGDNDSLIGGLGSDSLGGGAGEDMLQGGLGDDALYGDLGDDLLEGGDGADTLLGGDDNDNLLGGLGDDELQGGLGSDLLEGGDGADTLLGGGDNDTLFGNAGDDVLNSGAGFDELFGGDGNDVYQLNLGDGEDVIADTDGVNVVSFGANITSSDLQVSQYQGNDGSYYLRVSYGVLGDNVVIKDGLTGSIQEYQFDDGSSISHADLIGVSGVAFEVYGTADSDSSLYGSNNNDVFYAGAGDDHAYGKDGDDTLNGEAGNDTLEGGNGNDTLDGGLGNDILLGEAGHDSYLMAWGMGQDTAIETADNALNTILLDVGVALSDLSYKRVGDDLLIHFKSIEEGLSLKDYYLGDQNWQLVDQDSTVTTVADFLATTDDTVGIQKEFDAYQASVKAHYYTVLGADGYKLDANGVFRSITTSSSLTHFSTTIRSADYNVVDQVTNSTDIVRRITEGEVFTSTLISRTSVLLNVYGEDAHGGFDYGDAVWGRGGGAGAGGGLSGAGARFIPFSDDSVSTRIPSGSSYIYVPATGGSAAGLWITSSNNPSGPPSGPAVEPFVTSEFEETSTYTLENITTGDADNLIYVGDYNSFTSVNAGAGNDTIDGGGGVNYMTDSSNNYNALGAFYNGEAGDDDILGSIYNDVIIGGDGADTLDGGLGADRYLLYANDTGIDTIDDRGYLSGYNNDTPNSSYDFWYLQANGVDPYLGLAPYIAPNDYDALAPLYAAGLIEKDTVEFGEGIELANLEITYQPGAGASTGTAYRPIEYYDFIQDSHLGNLTISWGDNKGVRIKMPDGSGPLPELNGPVGILSTYRSGHWGLGYGIEQFKFADGTILTMQQLLGLATVLDTPIYGTDEDDELSAEGGDFTLIGGLGNDTYIVDSAGDIVIENLDEGYDIVESSVSYTLTENVEELVLTGTASIDGTGNDLDNYITGNAGDNVLSGGLGNDNLSVFNNNGNNILNGGEGDDYLDGGLGNDTLNGGAGNDDLYGGSSGNNILNGGEGDDYLDGGLGNDTLNGGAGDDDLYGGSSGNNILNGGEGDDYLNGGSSGNNILNGGEGDDYLDGGFGNAMLNGGAGNDTFTSYQGNSTLIGGAGSDVYYLYDEGNNAIIDEVGNDSADVDVVRINGFSPEEILLQKSNNNLVLDYGGSSVIITDWYVADSNTIEEIVFDYKDADGESVTTNWDKATITAMAPADTLVLTGNGDNNMLTGGDGNDRLYGRGGNDTLIGGAGNDRLNGGEGADVMSGGAGDDIYTVDNIGDVVTELADEGDNDRVNSAISYALGDNIERLNLTGADNINATGNALNNVLTGNDGNNVLDGGDGSDRLYGYAGNDTLIGGAGNDILNGGEGADVMSGGAGDDIYTVDNIGDVVTELADEGDNDRVNSAISYALGDNIERLNLTGTDNINATGNALNNVLTGNDGNNVLDGGDGSDTLVSYLGNDTLIGGAGNDILNGGEGADVMSGGAGDDIYTVDNIGDVVTELADEGDNDRVNSAISYALGDNIERLNLTGADNINATGNALNNVLTGNDGNNVLDGGDGSDTLVSYLGNDTLIGGAGNDILNGGEGADVMSGGAGDDIYTVDNIGDVVTELADEGDNDRVNSAISYALGDNIERLNLTGADNINATGNALNNVLTGNDGNNVLDGGDGSDTLVSYLGNDTLIGGAGNDILNGGEGADVMSGGAGDDIYTVDNIGDVVTELADEGDNDRVNSAISYALGDNIERLTLTGANDLIGVGNQLANVLAGNAGNNYLYGLGGDDIINGRDAVDLLQGGADNDILNGGAGNSLQDGGAGDDRLRGNDENDLLIGGLGNDIITTGTGYDVISFNAGDGQDSVNASADADNTLSLGGDFTYSDLSLTKTGNHLVLNMGTDDKITFKGWYANAGNASITNLQVIAEAMQGFSLGGTDALLDNKAENFDFASLVAQFDAEGATADWQLTDARLTAHLQAGSNSAAIGGDIAYQYGLNGSLTGMGVNHAQSVVSGANFGQGAQALNDPNVWQAETVKLG